MTDEQEHTTDENEPMTAGVAPQPQDITPPVDDVDDDEPGEGEDEEPLEATRLSPYAVAAFAVSLLALFQAPQNLFTAQGLQLREFFRYALPALAVPAGASALGLWLAFRGDEEIFLAAGRFGGVGFVRAAKVISVGVILLCITAVVLILFFSEQPQQNLQFG